jgi:hypothetical protein
MRVVRAQLRLQPAASRGREYLNARAPKAADPGFGARVHGPFFHRKMRNSLDRRHPQLPDLHEDSLEDRTGNSYTHLCIFYPAQAAFPGPLYIEATRGFMP